MATSTSEYQAKRSTPWSISPRLASGSTTYGLLVSQVFAGDGRFRDHVWLLMLHSISTPPMPTSGSRPKRIFRRVSFAMATP